MKKEFLIIALMLAGVFAFRAEARQNDTTAHKTSSDTMLGRRKTAEERAESLANRLKDKLELKDKQIAELKEIFMKREKALDSFWEQVRKSEDEMMADLKKALSAEQMQKFKDVYKRQVPQTPMSPLKRDSLQPGPPPMKK